MADEWENEEEQEEDEEERSSFKQQTLDEALAERERQAELSLRRAEKLQRDKEEAQAARKARQIRQGTWKGNLDELEPPEEQAGEPEAEGDPFAGGVKPGGGEWPQPMPGGVQPGPPQQQGQGAGLEALQTVLEQIHDEMREMKEILVEIKEGLPPAGAFGP